MKQNLYFSELLDGLNELVSESSLQVEKFITDKKIHLNNFYAMPRSMLGIEQDEKKPLSLFYRNVVEWVNRKNWTVQVQEEKRLKEINMLARSS
jgi:hypothetical protein